MAEKEIPKLSISYLRQMFSRAVLNFHWKCSLYDMACTDLKKGVKRCTKISIVDVNRSLQEHSIQVKFKTLDRSQQSKFCSKVQHVCRSLQICRLHTVYCSQISQPQLNFTTSTKPALSHGSVKLRGLKLLTFPGYINQFALILIYGVFFAV